MASHAASARDFTAAAAPAAAARPRAIAAWLFAVAALVFAMVVVGGITRLTESGLSIVKWDVVSGTLPPLTDADWAAQFDAYRTSSQYSLINQGMSLAAFKGIFFWEYAHRLLGRMIGVAFALPLAWFWLRRAIPAGYKPRLLALLALGGLQGAVGWWMVASGLMARAAVAHERLAVHLTMALIIMGGCIWTALDLRRGAPPDTARPHRWVIPFALLLGAQIVYGAFTAGMHAGHVSDTWPLMFGTLVPPGVFAAAADFVDAPVTVHFIHRSLAYGVAAAALVVAWRTRAAGAGNRALALAALVVVQFTLGVLTVVNGVALPLAAAHQAGAALLVVATTVLAHWARQKPA